AHVIRVRGWKMFVSLLIGFNVAYFCYRRLVENLLGVGPPFVSMCIKSSRKTFQTVHSD
ncbi:hypothetical protein L9F63_010680, partial [Diploptera punctata]